MARTCSLVLSLALLMSRFRATTSGLVCIPTSSRRQPTSKGLHRTRITLLVTHIVSKIKDYDYTDAVDERQSFSRRGFSGRVRPHERRCSRCLEPPRLFLVRSTPNLCKVLWLCARILDQKSSGTQFAHLHLGVFDPASPTEVSRALCRYAPRIISGTKRQDLNVNL